MLALGAPPVAQPQRASLPVAAGASPRGAFFCSSAQQLPAASAPAYASAGDGAATHDTALGARRAASATIDVSAETAAAAAAYADAGMGVGAAAGEGVAADWGDGVDEHGRPLSRRRYHVSLVKPPVRRSVLLKAEQPHALIELPTDDGDGDDDGDGGDGGDGDAAAQKGGRPPRADPFAAAVAAVGLDPRGGAHGDVADTPLAALHCAGAASIGTPGGTPSLHYRPSLSGGSVARGAAGLSPPSPESGAAGRHYAPKLVPGAGSPLRQPAALSEWIGAGGGGGVSPASEGSSPTASAVEEGGSGPANAGCGPGLVDGTGEGLSALFVHPDQDVYLFTEGGGILAEPPRTFEALAFAPRVGGRRSPSPSPTARAANGAADGAAGVAVSAACGAACGAVCAAAHGTPRDEMLINFASAATLGAHRTPPREFTHGRASSPAMDGATWQMWASDNLTEAIGVPPDPRHQTSGGPGDGDDGVELAVPNAEAAVAAAAEAPAPRDESAGRKDGKPPVQPRNKARGAAPQRAAPSEAAPSASAGASASAASTEPAAAAGDEAFRKMHINYKPVLAPEKAAGAADEADARHRSAAAGLFRRGGQAPPSSKGKDAGGGKKR